MSHSAVKHDHDLIANIGYEMLGSLNAVIVLAEKIEKHPELPNVLHRYSQELIRASKDASKVATDMWDYASLERDKVTLQLNRFSLRDTLQYLFLYFDKPITAKGIVFEMVEVPDAINFLVGDSIRLGQVLMNLLRNSLKFTNHGVIRVDMDVIPTQNTNSVHLEFTVSDSGSEIEPQHKDSLFEVFTNSDSISDRRFGSYGLELAICKRLVQLMGGSIKVESNVDGGCIFSFDVHLTRE